MSFCRARALSHGARPATESRPGRRRAARGAGGAGRGVAWGLLSSLGLLAGSGCGYSSSALYRPGIHTVHVEIFQSREFRRDLEFWLTEAVKKRIGADTPYRLASRDTADTVLKGEVLEERQAAFAPDFRTRIPRDTQLTLAVRVEWKDMRSGKILLDQSVLLQAEDYLPPAGESEAFTQQKAIDRLAGRIVAKMYDEW